MSTLPTIPTAPHAPAVHPATKRRYPCPTWQSHPCKRPRRQLTPGSVISATPSDSSTPHPDPVLQPPAPVFAPPPPAESHPHTHAHARYLLTPLSPTPEPLVHNHPNTYFHNPHVQQLTNFHNTNTDFNPHFPYPHPITTNNNIHYYHPQNHHQDHHHDHHHHSRLRSDAEILGDVRNSFSGSHAPALACTPELLVHVLANEVEDLIFANDNKQSISDARSAMRRPGSEEFETFYSSYKQPFELDFYMRRLVQYVNCSTAVYVTMFVYLERVQERCAALQLSDMNCHRLVFTCLVLAVKYLEDEVHSNAYYARVGGLTVPEMNSLEVKLLDVLQWNLTVSPETYGVFEEGLLQTASLLLAGPSHGYASAVTDEEGGGDEEGSDGYSDDYSDECEDEYGDNESDGEDVEAEN